MPPVTPTTPPPVRSPAILPRDRGRNASGQPHVGKNRRPTAARPSHPPTEARNGTLQAHNPSPVPPGLLSARPLAAVEISIGRFFSQSKNSRSNASVQPSLRARMARANSDSFVNARNSESGLNDSKSLAGACAKRFSEHPRRPKAVPASALSDVYLQCRNRCHGLHCPYRRAKAIHGVIDRRKGWYFLTPQQSRKSPACRSHASCLEMQKEPRNSRLFACLFKIDPSS